MINKRQIACDRLALDEQARQRHFEEVTPALLALPKTVRELENGFEFSFSPAPGLMDLLTEWATAERSCCPFFEIEVSPDSLRLTGGDSVKEFIRVEFAGWFHIEDR